MTVGLDSPVEIVCCHAEGEVGDVIVGGVEPPPGKTIWDQAQWIANDQSLRNFVLNEPRGGVFRHVNLLVPAIDPRAATGWIVMEPEDTPPMSGSNSICVSTVLLETGIIPMIEPETRFILEAPGGLVDVSAQCRNGKAQQITVKNVPSFADRLDAHLEIEGIGTLTVDTAYGGDTFVIVDSAGHRYLRADAATSPSFEAAGSDKHGRMPYWQIPDGVLADPDQLLEWASAARDVAHTAKKK